MILTILCFIYTFWVTYSYGFYTAKLVCGKKGYIDFPPAYYCIAGFAILSAIGQYISLFLPLGFTAHTIIFLGAFIIIIFYYNDIYNDIYNGFLKLFENIINAPLSLKFIFIILVLWILLYASRTPRGYDFYLYHTQAIRWIEEYGIVPGLGNVHGRLAFNSSWFILQALFGFTFIFKEPLHFLNGFFFFLSLTLFWQGILDIYNKKMAINSLVKLLFFFVLLYLIRGVIHNLVDPILSLLILVVITLWFERKKDLNDLTIFFLFLFCSLAFTIKVSSAPIFLLPFICFIHMLRKMDYINIYKTLLISVLIILPFLIRNIIISGYLLYPFPYINLFSFDWKIPLSAVIAEKEWIYSWARIPLMHPHKVLSLSINEWLPLWFIARSFIDKLIVLVMIASFISFFVGIMRHKKTFQIFELQGVLAVGIGFWFITAPDLRFAYGFIGILHYSVNTFIKS